MAITVNNKAYDVYKDAADRSKNNAALKVRKIMKNDCKTDDTADCGVLIDGPCQCRGFSSLNGVAVALCHDNTKVNNTIVLSKFCKGHQVWEKKKVTVEYEEWECTHKYRINHTGSSGAIGSVGAIEIFYFSVEKYKLRHLKILGDSGTGSVTKVVQS